jgi:hypothetical protein
LASLATLPLIVGCGAPLLVLYRLGLLSTVLALALVALINLAFARFGEILARSTARCRLKQVHRAG